MFLSLEGGSALLDVVELGPGLVAAAAVRLGDDGLLVSVAAAFVAGFAAERVAAAFDAMLAPVFDVATLVDGGFEVPGAGVSACAPATAVLDAGLVLALDAAVPVVAALVDCLTEVPDAAVDAGLPVMACFAAVPDFTAGFEVGLVVVAAAVVGVSPAAILFVPCDNFGTAPADDVATFLLDSGGELCRFPVMLPGAMAGAALDPCCMGNGALPCESCWLETDPDVFIPSFDAGSKRWVTAEAARALDVSVVIEPGFQEFSRILFLGPVTNLLNATGIRLPTHHNPR